MTHPSPIVGEAVGGRGLGRRNLISCHPQRWTPAADFQVYTVMGFFQHPKPRQLLHQPMTHPSPIDGEAVGGHGMGGNRSVGFEGFAGGAACLLWFPGCALPHRGSAFALPYPVHPPLHFLVVRLVIHPAAGWKKVAAHDDDLKHSQHPQRVAPTVDVGAQGLLLH